MKRKLLEILAIIVLLIILSLITILLIKRLNNKQIDNHVIDEIDNYVIHYYTGHYVYYIEPKEDWIYVEKNEVIMCNVAPCKPVKKDSFKVEYTEEYIDLIEKLFKDKNTKKVTVTGSDLSEEDLKIISIIVKEDNKEENSLSYNIMDFGIYSLDYSKRGYYIEDYEKGEVLLTVSMGTQSTGGYNISIIRILTIDDGVQIYVEETEPPKDYNVTQELNCPKVQVKFSKMPKHIMVQSLSNFKNFERIDIE